LRDTADLFLAFNNRAQRSGWPIRCDAQMSFYSEKLTAAHAVWRGAAGTRAWPERSALTARSMKPYLADMSIIDVVKSGRGNRYRSRLTGTALEYSYGASGGQFLDEIVPEPFRDRWIGALTLAAEASHPLRTIGRVEFRPHEYLQVESLLAPLGPQADLPDALLLVAEVSALSEEVAALLPTRAIWPERKTESGVIPLR
jgi:hypothetical protein